jgi:steroid 5-alpha reductase family enzyme
MVEVGFEGLALVMGGALVLWLRSLALRDASIADTFWGLGFVILAGFYMARTGGWPVRGAIVIFLTAAWGIRLALHIHRRNRGAPEDARYAAWRRRSGEAFWWRSLFTVFLLQAVLCWIVALPLLVAVAAPSPERLTTFDVAGIVLWSIGFAFETIGDAQLSAFRGDPSNAVKVLDTGLWRYTRHPNYFGDATVWWGFYVLAIAVPGGEWTVFSPLLMTVLLLRVSGVALLEDGLRERRPGYAEYVSRTSPFFPLPPRRSESPEGPADP